MLTLIDRYLRPRPGGKLMLGRFSQYLNNINRNVEQVLAYYLETVVEPIPTAGIDLINELLIRTDLKYLLSRDNDFDRFRKIEKEYTSMFGSYIRQYPVKEKTFFKSRSIRTNEIILFTDRFDLPSIIPFGSNNWDEWAKLRPVQILFANTFELSMNNRSSSIKYSTLPPSEVVISINIPLLLNLYTKYRIINKNSKEEFGLRTDNYPFIYKTCIAPLIKDLTSCWVTNIIDSMISGKLENPDFKFNTDLLIGMERAYFISSGIDAFDDLEKMIDTYIKGTMEPAVLLNSLMINTEQSLLEKTIEVKDNHFIKDGGQDIWLTFMKDYQYFHILKNVYELKPDLNTSEQFFRLSTIIGNKYRNTRFWNHAKNPFIRSIIEERFIELFNM